MCKVSILHHTNAVIHSLPSLNLHTSTHPAHSFTQTTTHPLPSLCSSLLSSCFSLHGLLDTTLSSALTDFSHPSATHTHPTQLNSIPTGPWSPACMSQTPVLPFHFLYLTSLSTHTAFRNPSPPHPTSHQQQLLNPPLPPLPLCIGLACDGGTGLCSLPLPFLLLTDADQAGACPS